MIQVWVLSNSGKYQVYQSHAWIHINDKKAPSIVQECAEYSAACFNADGMDAFLTNLDRKDPMKASPTPRVSITSTARADCLNL